MKTQTDDLLSNIRPQASYKEKKTRNQNPSELTPIPMDDVLTSGCKGVEKESIDKSTLRTLEISRKGIFACPKLTRFFDDNEDDVRIC